MNTNILLVDDTPVNLLVLQELLAKEGRSFYTAGSGKEALKLAREAEIDLIILDVQMPDMDGFEVAQILKSNNKTKDVPVIFATATKKEHRSMMQGYVEGAVDYLFKPLDPEITRAKVSILLKIQMQKKELLEKNSSLEKASRQISQLNNELIENMEQLKEVNQEMESFSYSVSHDLRAPLRALTGYSQILQEDYGDKLDDEAKKLLEHIMHNSIRMNELINDLLSFSRIGRKPVSKAPVDMNALVGKVVKAISESAPHHAIIKIENLEPGYGDASLLEQVWVNLINNAIKYSAKKENPEITITSEPESKEIKYLIKDNGVGFNMKYIDKLFGVFQRLHSSQEFEGTGVGLATVQRIIKKHGGRIWAEAEENVGATFAFTLPQKDQ